MATIRHRRATKLQWTAFDPVLAAGEIGFEIDTGKFKIGDGLTKWESLGYFLGEADVRSLLGDGDGDSNIAIDDVATSLDSTWSSSKISSELHTRVPEDQNVTVILTEAGFINVANGEFIDIPIDESQNSEKLSLRMGLAMVYSEMIKLNAKFVEKIRLLDSDTLLSVGLSPYANGIESIPMELGLNESVLLSVELDEPSSSGDVKFELVAINGSNHDSNRSSEITIPQGVRQVYFNEPTNGDITPRLWVPGTGNRGVASIINPGVGAKGLTIRVLRTYG